MPEQMTIATTPSAPEGIRCPPASGSAFRCVVADPPWKLPIGKTRTANGETDSAWKRPEYSERHELQYPQMTVEEIAALQVPAAKDAHLYIWTINRYVEAAYEIARAWGFAPATLLTWIKAPMGLGLGGTYCNTTEYVLFARRGNAPAKRRVETTWWGWPRGRHSEKPEAFQTLVESVSPGPYLEMFARRKRPGWAHWGNEITSDVEIRPNDQAERPE